MPVIKTKDGTESARYSTRKPGCHNDSSNNLDHDQTEEEARTCEVSDDTLEAASGTSARWAPTLFHTTYCFGCPG